MSNEQAPMPLPPLDVKSVLAELLSHADASLELERSLDWMVFVLFAGRDAVGWQCRPQDTLAISHDASVVDFNGSAVLESEGDRYCSQNTRSVAGI